MWQFYGRRFKRVLPPFIIFMVLYSTLPLLWGQIDKATALNDLARIPLNFPSLAGHLWFMYPLISLYLFIPVISHWLRRATPKEELFFIALFVLSTCMPYLHRWFGDLWGECFWNEFHVLWYFSGYLGYVVLAHYIRVHLKWNRKTRFLAGLAMAAACAAYGCRHTVHIRLHFHQQFCHCENHRLHSRQQMGDRLMRIPYICIDAVFAAV